MVKVGEYYTSSDDVKTGGWEAMQWPDNSAPPRDGSLKHYELFRIATAVSVTLWTLSAAGLLLAVCFLGVNIVFRRHQ